jgi:hypothetical protein
LKSGAYKIIISCLYGQLLGPEEINDTCRKTTNVRMMDVDFIAFTSDM